MNLVFGGILIAAGGHVVALVFHDETSEVVPQLDSNSITDTAGACCSKSIVNVRVVASVCAQVSAAVSASLS